MMEDPRGRGEGVALTAVAGLLFIAEGVYVSGGSVPLPFSDVPLQVAGVLSALAGLSLLILAVVYRTSPAYRSLLGTLAVLFAAGDLWFGGGFLVGSVVGTIGGLLMILLPLYDAAWSQRTDL
jgi:hypothetical protein